jgi:2-oxoglutarate/2-oxoacid ferredoxin oxidoreductase subunit alpha
MTELPLIVMDVQRGGPSTGLPTKTEQADLLQAYYGRNGECPMPVIAAATPADCFDMAIEACRIAIKYMTPVLYLTDGYLANGAEPWKLPNVADLPKIPVQFRTNPENYKVYQRDATTLARQWVRPGTPGLEHRIGGLEKDFLTGNVSYDPLNHEAMVRMRAEKVANIANDIPLQTILGDDKGDLLVVGWGGTYGALTQAVKQARLNGKKVSAIHLRHLNPLPRNLGEILHSFKHVLCCELNMGQLQKILRGIFALDIKGYHKIQGKPFKVSEILHAIDAGIEGREIAPPPRPSLGPSESHANETEAGG